MIDNLQKRMSIHISACTKDRLADCVEILTCSIVADSVLERVATRAEIRVMFRVMARAAEEMNR